MFKYESMQEVTSKAAVKYPEVEKDSIREAKNKCNNGMSYKSVIPCASFRLDLCKKGEPSFYRSLL
jgi:hypothetical protein